MSDSIREKLLEATTRDEFFRTLYFWLKEAKSGIYVIDDIFTERQPKYRAYLIECLDEIIYSGAAPFEIDRTETKFRKNAEDNYVNTFASWRNGVWAEDDVCEPPSSSGNGSATGKWVQRSRRK